MQRSPIRTTIVCLGLLMAGAAIADEPAAPPAPPANPLDAIPDNMPFNTPYGPAISLQRAQAAIQAAQAEAVKRGWAMNIAVVDSGANLVTMVRMDGAQIASVEICEVSEPISAPGSPTTMIPGGWTNA